MEENENVEVQSSGGNKNLIIGAVVVVLLLIVAGVIYANFSNSADNGNQAAGTSEETLLDTTDNTQATPATELTMDEEALQPMQLQVEGGSFYYEPNEIRVQAGQTVIVTLNSVDGMHDFVIDELGVASEVIQAGESGSVTFTAPNEPGEYAFYCSVGNHRAQGMEGTLIVE